MNFNDIGGGDDVAFQQGNDGGLRELALFAGAGGGILGGKLLGWRTVCAVERDAYAAQVLAQRQDDGCLEPFPIWSDIEHFDGRPWRGIVDVVSGGFPCQDISVAGDGAGLDGERSGLWGEMARIVCEVQPLYVYVENSPMLTSRGLGRVLGDLAALGFDAEWGVVSAADAGAAHLRERIWIAAHSNSHRLQGGALAGSGRERRARSQQRAAGFLPAGAWVETAKAGGFGVSDGVPTWMDRTRAIGNGQVPAVAAAAWRILSQP